MKIKLHAFFILAFSILLLTCKKSDVSGPQTEVPDFQNRVVASASGFVTDENNAAVAGAQVSMGGYSSYTDEFGYFSFNNVPVVKNAGVIKVTHYGYFAGIRTFTAEEGKDAFVRIRLSPKTEVGNIDAASGGTATDLNGLSVSLPADGVVDAQSGAAYSGPVSVFARWLDPSSREIFSTMPGDLRAIDAAGSLRLLITYGMAAVELRGAGGQLLQIAPGKKSLLTFPMPAHMLANAPSMIPLWYFDEEKGLWSEEGRATKNGNIYSGEVSHYSFWNLNIPTQVVNFQARLTDGSGAPVSGAFVKIYKTDDPMAVGTGFTNSSGYVSGGIPANADLVFEVYSNIQCTDVSFTQNVATGSFPVNFGDVVLPGQRVAKVHGSVENCGFAPIQQGFVVLNVGGYNYRHDVDSNSSFSFVTPLCGSNGQATILAVDLMNLQQSNAVHFTITPGDNEVPALRACGISALEFVQVTFRDTTYTITSPSEIFTASGPPTANLLRLETGFNVDTVYNVSSYIFMDRLGMAVGSTHVLYDAWFSNAGYIPPNATTGNTSPVTITEFGTIGEFMSGYFSYDFFTAEGAPFGTMHYTFRFRRAF